MFGNRLIVLVFVVVSVQHIPGTASFKTEGTLLTWNDVQSVSLADLEPAGYEKRGLNSTIYVARTSHLESGIIPGKYVEKYASCYYSHNGVSHETTNCEVKIKYYLKNMLYTRYILTKGNILGSYLPKRIRKLDSSRKRRVFR